MDYHLLHSGDILFCEDDVCRQIIRDLSDTYNYHILHHHHADFEVCQEKKCRAIREFDQMLLGENYVI